MLSGADYPIRSNEYIKNFFEKNKGKNFINVVAMPFNGKSFDRIEYYYLEGGFRNDSLGGYIVKLINFLIRMCGVKRKYPQEYSHYILYGGSQWWALTHDCVKYILEFCTKNKKFINFYKHTLIPDEMFFHTIIMNSPFKSTIMNSVTYSDWTLGEPPYPALIDRVHIPLLKQKVISTSYGLSEILFARKFNDNSIFILEEIDKIRNEVL